MIQFSDYVEIVMGQSPKGTACSGTPIGLPLLNGPTEFGSHHPYPTQWTTDPKRFAQPNDLLFCVRGSTTGRMNWADQEYAIGRGIAAIRHKGGLAFQPWVRSVIEYQLKGLLIVATGSTFPNVSKDQLRCMEVPEHNEWEQREIAAVLGALDDKIELNRKTSATLEEMARALYRSWFVDFDPVHAKREGRAPAHMDTQTASFFPDSFGDDGLPEGWEAGTLADISLLNPSKHSKKNHPAQIEYIDLANTKWGLIGATTAYQWEDAPSRARMSLAAGDTIVGTVRPGNGSFSFVSKNDLTGSTGFAVLRPKYDRDASLIYLAATDQATIEVLANLADGGAYPAVRPEVVSARKIVLAPDDLLLAFSQEVFPLIAKIEIGKDENQTLAALRDTLLPRLMSGELRVGVAREQVEERI